MAKRAKKHGATSNLQAALAIEPVRAFVVKRPVKPAAAAATPRSLDISKYWLVGGLAIIAVAVLMRFAWITLKPFHHDEGVNGLFMLSLFRDGVYRYDPSNYHGPTLYYFALASSYLFGLNDFAVRFVTAVSGVLIVALIVSLRRYLGAVGTLFAASLVALSPGLTFISRYFIHEIIFLFFTFGVVVGVLKFVEGERPGRIANAAMSLLLFVCLLPFALTLASYIGSNHNELLYVVRFLCCAAIIAFVYFAMEWLSKWNEGRPIYLILAAASASLTFSTKETAFISFGTMLIALGCVWMWIRFFTDQANGIKHRRTALIALHALLLLLGIYYRKEAGDGALWFYQSYFVNAANKEQPLILVAIIALLIGGAAVWARYFLYVRPDELNESNVDEAAELNYHTFLQRLGGDSFSRAIVIVVSAATFILVGIVFFSSFFTYFEGVTGALKAYDIWIKTGSKDHTQSSLWGYLKWLLSAEASLLVLGALGALMAFWKAKHRFAMFAGLWAFGLFAAYTVIPYKTPWLAINFLLPMALVAGYGINELATSRQLWQRRAATLLAVLGIGLCAYQTVELNFYRYDDNERPYIYVHTQRSMNEMMGIIKRVAARAGTNKQASVIIASPEYFPLPWTLHEYKNAVFHGKVVDAPNSEIIVGSKAQTTELEQKYSTTHKFIGTYPLRPGVDLLLYARKDLAQL